MFARTSPMYNLAHQNTQLYNQGANSLIYNQIFGFSAFRKRLGLYSYKLGRNSRNKNPHAIPYHIKQ